MTRILRLADMTSKDLALLKRRAELDIENALSIAKEVIEKIKQDGDAGVLEYVRKFDFAGAKIENLKVTEEEFAQAQNTIDLEIKKAIAHAFSNIKEVHQRQMPEEIQMAEIERGVFAGEKSNAHCQRRIICSQRQRGISFCHAHAECTRCGGWSSSNHCLYSSR